MTEPLDLVLAGNLLVDDIVLADGTTLLGEPGGAVLHAALAKEPNMVLILADDQDQLLGGMDYLPYIKK